jgi:hypothetical protein
VVFHDADRWGALGGKALRQIALCAIFRFVISAYCDWGCGVCVANGLRDLCATMRRSLRLVGGLPWNTFQDTKRLHAAVRLGEPRLGV